MKKLGVIGGLGPMATAWFMEKVTELTDAKTDQEHIEMLIHSCPSIPDRTKFILGESKENPVPKIVEIGQNLVKNGAKVIAIPCISSHAFIDEIKVALEVPVVDGIDETIHEIVSTCVNEKNNGNQGVKSTKNPSRRNEKTEKIRVGILATDGTLRCGIFQSKLEKAGFEVVLPNEENQKKVMHLIYENVKANRPIEMDLFYDVVQALKERNVSVVILGCTELSRVLQNSAFQNRMAAYETGRQGEDEPKYVDVLEVIAKAAVRQCGV